MSNNFDLEKRSLAIIRLLITWSNPSLVSVLTSPVYYVPMCIFSYREAGCQGASLNLRHIMNPMNMMK